jgi:hypothetical protein
MNFPVKSVVSYKTDLHFDVLVRFERPPAAVPETHGLFSKNNLSKWVV